MKLSANVTSKFADFARVEALIVPKLIEGAKNGANVVLEVSQPLVAVDTGLLKSTGRASVEWVGKKVTGYVTYGEGIPDNRAAYVEFGTGAAGASSPGAGPFAYTESWPGQVAQPYLRPAIDASKNQALDAFKDALE